MSDVFYKGLRIIVNILMGLWIALGILFFIVVAVYTFMHSKDVGLIISAFLILITIIGIPIILKYNAKEIGLCTVFLFLIAIADTSAINTLVITFFFNTVFTKLFFDYEWNQREKRIQNTINEKSETGLFIFDKEFFSRMKQQIQIGTTIVVYSLSVLPSVALDLIIKKKQYLIWLISKISFIDEFYQDYLQATKDTILYKTEFKRLIVAIPMFLMALLFDLFLFYFSKQFASNREKLNIRREREESYWGKIDFGLDDDDLVYIIKNPDSKPVKVHKHNKEKYIG